MVSEIRLGKRDALTEEKKTAFATAAAILKVAGVSLHLPPCLKKTARGETARGEQTARCPPFLIRL